MSAIPATPQAIFPFQPTQGGFATGPPSLRTSEGGAEFPCQTGDGFLATLRSRDGTDAAVVAGAVVNRTPISAIRGDDGRIPAKPGAMAVQSGKQGFGVRGIPPVHGIVSDKAVFRFHDLDLVAKLDRAPELSFLDGPGIGISQADDSLRHSFPGRRGPALMDHRAQVGQRLLQLRRQARGLSDGGHAAGCHQEPCGRTALRFTQARQFFRDGPHPLDGVARPMSEHLADAKHLLFDATGAVTDGDGGLTEQLLQAAGMTRYPPNPVRYEPRIAGIMNVRLDDRGILLKSPAPNHFLVSKAGHDCRIKRLDSVWTDPTTPVGQGGGVR